MADAPDRRPINPVRYTARDFNTIFDALLRRAQVEFGDTYNDFVSTDLGVMFMDLMAFGLTHLHWYADRRASESFLDTARTRAAISRLTRQIGYKMRPAAASSTELTVTIDRDTVSGTGVLPEGFAFTGPNGLIFEAISDVTVDPTAGDLTQPIEITVPVREGETRTINFTSSGEANQIFELFGVDFEGGEYVADKSVQVTVDSAVWTESEFIDFEVTDQYEVDYNGEPPFVRFGNGVAGNIPAEDASIEVQFVVMNGASGNVTSSTITAAEDTLIILGDVVTILSVDNPQGSTGGVDPEDPERARVLAPLSFASRGVAITKSDYETNVLAFTDPQYGSPAAVTASVVREASLDVFVSNALDTILDAISDYDSDISADSTSVVEDSDALIAALDTIGTYRTTVEDEAISIESQSTTVRSLSSQINSDASDALADISLVEDLFDDVSGIRWVLDQLVDGSIDADEAHSEVENRLNSAENLLTEARAELNSISGLTSSVSSALSTLETSVDAQQTAMDSQEIEESTASSLATSIQTETQSIVDAFGPTETDIESEVSSLRSYLDGLFSDSCKANVVSVPILSKDAGGFYASPSIGLINAVQEYLEGIKEVTHAVRVVDGGDALVSADVSVEYLPTSSAVKAEVKASIEAVVDTVLRDREFGDDLYLSTLYNAITNNVDDIVRVNVDITGDASYLSDGNLEVGPTRVITKGTVTVTEDA